MKVLFKFILPWFLPAFISALLFSSCPDPAGPKLEPPVAPGPLSVVNGDEELLVSWAAVAGATAYDVYYGENAPALAVTVSTPEAVVEDLANGTSYSVWVKAKNAAGESGYSPPGTGTPAAQQYTITYNTNGGSGEPPPEQTKWSSASVTVPGQGSLNPPEAGYVFSGWNTQANGGGWGYMPNETYTKKASVTFYARWVKYTGTVSVTGGTVTGSNSYTFTVTVPNNPAYSNPGSSSVRKGVFVEGRELTIPSFAMAAYETTQNLWYTVQNWALEHGYQFQNKKNNAPSSANENKPITGVSWRDAIVWCNAYSEMTNMEPVYRDSSGGVLRDSRNAAACDAAAMDKNKSGYRLPTEVEREFAARGGDPGRADWMYIYAGSNNADDVAWHHGNSAYTIHVVGEKAANRLNIHDLSGNVQEWCWDWMNWAVTVTPLTPVDGTAYSATPPLANQKAFNGGGVGSNLTMSCVAYRWGYSPNYTNSYVGFRVVRKP
ncbi:MAG: SUMF1/EgtB/PvdO family nonheme iron enzyme [Treponema sp.]|jgi:formylglycine-generating enzyme required for sulfatase activity|nr:SUMF1/EgtB/PvdO family nonheme iron enzyme [Treponema sp.]